MNGEVKKQNRNVWRTFPIWLTSIGRHPTTATPPQGRMNISI